jgi:hypothetical protein
MANPLQAASTKRKVIYLGVIVALFTATLFWRGKIDLPLSQAGQAMYGLNQRSVLKQAERMELRELDQGDPEIIGTAAQVALTGTRGLAVTVLWRAAIEKQKRNEFHDLETYVRLVTRLQPNFVTPWIFQSWNLAYNVSVENERLNDMYFYISRGIELLAEGEKINNSRVVLPTGEKIVVGSPDMRFQTAFYYQNKFSVSDKVTTLRSLMQVSCIPPPERNPDRFRNAPDAPVNAKEFEDFCRKNPQLVRRLREKLDCRRPDQVVDFLAENTKIPSLFIGATGDRAEPELQFPILPPSFEQGPDEYHAGSPNIDDRFDAFLAARAWYTYAQAVVPPNPTDASGQPIPTGVIRLTGTDRFRYRIPRSPAMILFRQGAPRAQSYLAERLTKEGWFDQDSAWKPDEFRDPSSYWFKRGDLDDDLALPPTDWSRLQWEKAFQMWEAHGQRNAMLLSVSRLNSLQKLAERVPTDTSVLQWPDEFILANGFRVEEVQARQALISFEQNRHVTNFGFFHSSSLAESQKLTVDARKLFGDAALQESQGNYDRALALYVKAMNVWRQVLVEYPEFHATERTQEDTFEILMKMSDLVAKELERPDGRKRLETMYATAAGAFGGLYPAAGKVDLDRVYAEDEVNLRISELDRRVQERVSEVMGGIDAAASPLVAAADATSRTTPTRATIARQIVEREYPWLRTRMTKDGLDKEWVRAPMVESVRSRMGLARRLPPEEGASPYETGIPPPPTPSRMPSQAPGN